MIGHVIQSGERTGDWGWKQGRRSKGAGPPRAGAAAALKAISCSAPPLLKMVSARTQHWFLLISKTFHLLIYLLLCWAFVPASWGHALAVVRRLLLQTTGSRVHGFQ